MLDHVVMSLIKKSTAAVGGDTLANTLELTGEFVKQGRFPKRIRNGYWRIRFDHLTGTAASEAYYDIISQICRGEISLLGSKQIGKFAALSKFSNTFKSNPITNNFYWETYSNNQIKCKIYCNASWWCVSHSNEFY
ncbi:hypothetical protein BGX26_003882 [Mortierella sp. AD094]|nr:hypothetical protein BGX26_003882 [Mortierella sp. AD094]